jgi:glycerol-3-phosphate acyltransferase PlsY
MTAAQQLLLLSPIAYLIGSIPFGLLVGLARGVDVRKAGSGNIGATNVGRLLGGKFFALVFTLDLLKGFLPVLAGAIIVRRSAAADAGTFAAWLAVALAAILGHMFSLFLKFKGGKGVATSTGVILGVFPYYTLPAVVAIIVFMAVFMATRYVSLGSMIGASAFTLAYLGLGLAMGWPVFGAQWPLLVFAALIAGLIIYKHRTNIARLRAGTENRFVKKSANSVAQS